MEQCYACRKQISISVNMTSSLRLYPQLGNVKIDLLWYKSVAPTTVSNKGIGFDLSSLKRLLESDEDILILSLKCFMLYTANTQEEIKVHHKHCLVLYVDVRLQQIDAFWCWKVKNVPPLPLWLSWNPYTALLWDSAAWINFFLQVCNNCISRWWCRKMARQYLSP